MTAEEVHKPVAIVAGASGDVFMTDTPEGIIAGKGKFGPSRYTKSGTYRSRSIQAP
jgi:hypothetical protein